MLPIAAVRRSRAQSGREAPGARRLLRSPATAGTALLYRSTLQYQSTPFVLRAIQGGLPTLQALRVLLARSHREMIHRPALLEGLESAARELQEARTTPHRLAARRRGRGISTQLCRSLLQDVPRLATGRARLRRKRLLTLGILRDRRGRPAHEWSRLYLCRWQPSRSPPAHLQRHRWRIRR